MPLPIPVPPYVSTEGGSINMSAVPQGHVLGNSERKAESSGCYKCFQVALGERSHRVKVMG